MAINVLGTWHALLAAEAVRPALDVPLPGHRRLLPCAADIAATGATLVMAGRFTPSVPVRDAAHFQREPRRALFDCSAAARVLGWAPRYTWSGHAACPTRPGHQHLG